MNDKKLIVSEEKEWKEFQERVKNAPEKVQRNIIGIALYAIEIKSHTTMCDEIELESWKAMPISMKVTDFCNHCEFKCDNGKLLIQLNNKRKSEQ